MSSPERRDIDHLSSLVNCAVAPSTALSRDSSAATRPTSVDFCFTRFIPAGVVPEDLSISVDLETCWRHGIRQSLLSPFAWCIQNSTLQLSRQLIVPGLVCAGNPQGNSWRSFFLNTKRVRVWIQTVIPLTPETLAGYGHYRLERRNGRPNMAGTLLAWSSAFEQSLELPIWYDAATST